MVSDVTRLLVVDDDPDSAVMVRQLLGRCGRPYVVDAAHDPRRLPAMLSGGAYHAWLLDHRFGDRLGHDILASLPDREQQPPVVVFTGTADTRIADRYAELGAADLLRKDEVTPDRIDRTIRFAIAQWRTRRQIELDAEAARRRERMAAIGRFAAGVAHEYNNLDAVLLAGMERLFLGASADPESRGQVERVVGAIERGRRISRTLLQLGKAADPPGNEVCDLCREVADGMQVLRGEADRARSDLQVQMTAAGCCVGLSAGEAHLLLSHLVGNAIHAVHASPVPQVRVRLERRPEEVALSVADNGIGIEPEDQPHVFQPFFTRKGPATARRCYPPAIQGAGLGLAVCLALVERAGGRITLCSAVGAGTTVMVRLPVRLPAPQPAAPVAAAPIQRGRALRVIVVDDNANLRELVVGALEGAGWEVRAYGDPREFLAAWEPSWCDLILLDWGLPGMEGGQVLAALADPARTAPVRVMVMSGGNFTLPSPRPAGLHLLPPLEKPFRMNSLIAAIHQTV